MSKWNWTRQVRYAGTALLLAGALTACDDDDAFVEPETEVQAQVAAIKITAGTQSVTLFKDGKITLAPISFVRPNVTITATLLDDQGNPLPNLTATEVDVKMGWQGSSSGSLTYTRTNAFSGVMGATGTAQPITGNFTVSLYDNEARRLVFGPFLVPVVLIR
jgi:hypothetical protein